VSERPILAITHIAPGDLGLLGEVLTERLMPIVPVRLDRGDELPDLAEVSAVVSLGGTMGVPDSGEYPFLRDELRLLESALASSVPVLGLCLGAQLLAKAAGGDVLRMATRDIGWYPLDRMPAADGDALFGPLPNGTPVLEWHLDAIVPPSAGEVIAESSGPGCSIFRVGSAAWGSQTHLELTPRILDDWLSDPVIGEELRQAGFPSDRLLDQAEELLPAQMTAAISIFERFADFVSARAGSEPGVVERR
jgi:GMP synthase (glutamine-hydrolysing)